MSKIIIVGAGGVGNVVAHKCAQSPNIFTEIILASRTLSKCQAIAKSVKDKTNIYIKCIKLDADNVSDTTKILKKERPELVINVALPYQDLNLMNSCINAKVDYLDTANYEPPNEAKFEYKWQWDYQERFRKLGLTALLGSGFDPGVTNVFCAYAQKHFFDSIETIDILDANAGDHGYPFATNFNPEINIREITQKGRYWREGKWIEVEPMSINREYNFPEVGKKNAYLLYHEELESLSKNIPNLKQIRFWMTFSKKYLLHLDVLKNVGMTSINPIEVKGIQIQPIEFLKSVLPDPSTLGEKTKGKTCIGCDITGIKDGNKKRIFIYNVSDHQKCYAEVLSQAISYTTGVPARIGAEMILSKKWRKPGVWNMEEMDPDPFMELLNKYGLPWHVLDLNPN